jgi:hypothetical protein
MRKTRLFAVLLIFGLVTAVPAMAAGPISLKELYLYPSFQYFTWEEFNAGRRLLKESGPLFGAGAAVLLESSRLDTGNTLTLKAKAELFGSVVDYDGTAQNVVTLETIPVTTDVTYFGTKGEIDAGWRYTCNAYYFEPFAGAGVRWWLRDIHNGTAVDNSGNTVQVIGYQEDWFSAYGRFGLKGGYAVAKDFRIFAEAGAKYPFYTQNSADFPGVGDVTVKPEGEWSAFAEIGAQYKWFRPSIFYEGFRYSQSPVVPVSTLEGMGIFQPQSESDIIGINLGFAFR